MLTFLYACIAVVLVGVLLFWTPKRYIFWD